MKLVVGLGNPGRKYEGTRHNIGFEVVYALARKHATGKPKTAFEAETIEADLNGVRALLLCPQTYMNLSGNSVSRAKEFYKLPDDDLLVICDDINLPLGKLRLRAQGSAGGQKGLADILRRLATEKVSRLRIGVGEVPGGRDASGFVLGRFGKHEVTEMELAVAHAVDAAVTWANAGIQTAMNQYN